MAREALQDKDRVLILGAYREDPPPDSEWGKFAAEALKKQDFEVDIQSKRTPPDLLKLSARTVAVILNSQAIRGENPPTSLSDEVRVIKSHLNDRGFEGPLIVGLWIESMKNKRDAFKNGASDIVAMTLSARGTWSGLTEHPDSFFAQRTKP